MVIDPKTTEFLKKKYSQELNDEVDIKVFTRDIIINNEHPEYAQFSKDLVRELSQIDSKIKAEYLSLQDETARELNVSVSPTIIVGKNNGYSIQYWGIPAGQVASSFIETISLVSQRESGLNEFLKERLKSIDKNLMIEIYISLDSSASSQAVLLANRIAIERPDKIISRTIEVEEAIERMKSFNIEKLPSVLINENHDSLISGLISEEKLLYQLILHGSSDNKTLLIQMEEEEKKKKELVDNPDYPVMRP
jgi:alkyl hydroperoxide reductase subunit AhpF